MCFRYERSCAFACTLARASGRSSSTVIFKMSDVNKISTSIVGTIENFSGARLTVTRTNYGKWSLSENSMREKKKIYIYMIYRESNGERVIIVKNDQIYFMYSREYRKINQIIQSNQMG